MAVRPEEDFNMIQLQNIVKSYPMGKGELTVLHGVNLNIEKGEMVAIMGPVRLRKKHPA